MRSADVIRIVSEHTSSAITGNRSEQKAASFSEPGSLDSCAASHWPSMLLPSLSTLWRSLIEPVKDVALPIVLGVTRIVVDMIVVAINVHASRKLGLVVAGRVPVDGVALLIVLSVTRIVIDMIVVAINAVPARSLHWR